MSRKLLTTDGYLKLKEELHYLVRERPGSHPNRSLGRQPGDRSENADYKENKRLLRQIDGRIRRLTKLFEVAEKVDYHKGQRRQSILALGSK